MIEQYCRSMCSLLNFFSAEFTKEDFSMFMKGRLPFSSNMEYFNNLRTNNVDCRFDSSKRAESPEYVLFAKPQVCLGAERVNPFHDTDDF